MRINTSDYSVEFYPDANRITFRGNLRLRTIDNYSDIMNFIIGHTRKCNDYMTLDITNLTNLNSAGIASFSLFFIKIRESGKKIRIIASEYIAWQKLCLEDLLQINPNIEFEYIVHH